MDNYKRLQMPLPCYVITLDVMRNVLFDPLGFDSQKGRQDSRFLGLFSDRVQCEFDKH